MNSSVDRSVNVAITKALRFFLISSLCHLSIACVSQTIDHRTSPSTGGRARYQGGAVRPPTSSGTPAPAPPVTVTPLPTPPATVVNSNSTDPYSTPPSAPGAEGLPNKTSVAAKEDQNFLELLAQPQVSARIGESIVLNRLNADQLEDVLKSKNLSGYHPLALWRLGQIQQKAKRFDKAIEFYRGLASQYAQHPLSSQARQLLQVLNAQQQVDAFVVGAVLPLTGKSSNVGQHVLNALRIGLGINKPNPKFRLAIYDTQSSPELAASGVDKLLIENKVIALVGGLSSREATYIAQRAELFSIPYFALSQKSGLTNVGDFVFRNALTPEMQVDRLVQFAFDKLGAKRYAILYPNDSYGVEFANIFWDQVLARGGQITAVQTYDNKENDFTGIIQKMVGTYFPEARAEEYEQRLSELKKQKKERALKNKKDKKSASKNSREHEVEESVLQPVVNFDVLFLPDSGKTLSQVMAFMKVNDVPGLTYLGTNIWNNSDIVKRATGQKDQKELIYFVDGLDPNDAGVRDSEFFKEYFTTYGEEPTLIEMQSFEVAKILRETILGGGIDRDQLVSRLRILGRSSGVTGELRMSNQREIERPIHVLSLDSGLIKKVY